MDRDEDIHRVIKKRMQRIMRIAGAQHLASSLKETLELVQQLKRVEARMHAGRSNDGPEVIDLTEDK